MLKNNVVFLFWGKIIILRKHYYFEEKQLFLWKISLSVGVHWKYEVGPVKGFQKEFEGFFKKAKKKRQKKFFKGINFLAQKDVCGFLPQESKTKHLKKKIAKIQGCTRSGSLAAGLRENGERMRKWRGNGQIMRKWSEIYSTFPHLLFIFSLFIHFQIKN